MDASCVQTTVYMGKGETFHGDVFVTLYGTEGRTDEMPLLRWWVAGCQVAPAAVGWTGGGRLDLG
jgi:hypothetical protein